MLKGLTTNDQSSDKPSCSVRLPPIAREHVYRVNELVRSIQQSEIVLSSASLAIPHITLLSGVPGSLNWSAERFSERLLSVAEDLLGEAGVSFGCFKEPYVSTATRCYVLSDVEFESSIVPIMHELRRLLVSEYFSYVSDLSPPHVTMSRVTEITPELIKLLQSIGDGPDFQLSAVALSRVGPNGTCIDTIRERRLNLVG